MTNNRDRISVKLGRQWMLYTNTIPPGAKALGVVTRAGFDSGALVLLASGLHVQINAGVIRTLPDAKVRAALAALAELTGAVGRPAEMAGGRRINVHLDSATVAVAQALGGGNLSAGIRAAVKKLAGSEKPRRT